MKILSLLILFSAVSLGLTGASQKIASLVATANQAQFQTRALNPVTLVRNMHGVSASTAQHVVVTSAGAVAGGDQQVTLIPQSVQLVGASSAAGATIVSSAGLQQQQHVVTGPGAPVLQQALTVQAGAAACGAGQQVQLQMFPQQVVLQQTQPQQLKLSMPPNGAEQGASAAEIASGWVGQEAKSSAVHVLVSGMGPKTVVLRPYSC